MRAFVHKYKWSHKEKKRMWFKRLDSGKARIVERNKDGWLFELNIERSGDSPEA